jgi:hypothetical protein
MTAASETMSITPPIYSPAETRDCEHFYDRDTVSSNGLDGVYRSPDGKIVIVEAKYGSSGMGRTVDGRQMSDGWLRGRTSAGPRLDKLSVTNWNLSTRSSTRSSKAT